MRRSGWAIVAVVLLAGGGLSGCSKSTEHTAVYSVSINQGVGNATFPLDSIKSYYIIDGDTKEDDLGSDTSLPWSKTVTFRGHGDVTGLNLTATFRIPSTADQANLPAVHCQISLDGSPIVAATTFGGVNCNADESLIKQKLGH